MKHLALLLCAMTGLWAMAGHVMIDGSITGTEHSIYPGTEHTFQVYVPEDYDGHHAACLYVGLDGVLCNAPTVIDSLIAAGKMPMTIGVFLQPGLVKDSSGQVVRYNRSNEFDATDGRFASFIEKELISAITGMTTPDGRHIIVAAGGENHMIFGLSSGGIAALVAAWHRPDLFGRVFSGVGTFVAMRGGNDLQAIVRKHEPLPLKVCLQDGTNDVWNALFGHWYEGNRMLATALDFAGYDTLYDWSDCKHGVKRASEIFAQVMTWMWSDWGKPIATGTTQNDFLAPLLIQGEKWTPAAGQPPHGAGAAGVFTATYPDGTLLARPIDGTNWLEQAIIGPDGAPHFSQRFYWLHSYDNSPVTVGPMAFDGNGNLWVATSAGLQICDQNGRVRGILTMPADAHNFWEITIDDGLVTLHGTATSYTRRLQVTAPTPSRRPKSQGQG